MELLQKNTCGSFWHLGCSFVWTSGSKGQQVKLSLISEEIIGNWGKGMPAPENVCHSQKHVLSAFVLDQHRFWEAPGRRYGHLDRSTSKNSLIEYRIMCLESRCRDRICKVQHSQNLSHTCSTADTDCRLSCQTSRRVEILSRVCDRWIVCSTVWQTDSDLPEPNESANGCTCSVK